MIWNEHPDRLTLSDWMDGFLSDEEATEVCDHVARCEPCQAVAEDAPVPVRRATRDTMAISLPTALVDGFSSYPPDPTPGELWQLVWEGVGDLALVVGVHGPSVDVVPAEPDGELGDDQTVKVPESSSLAMFAGALWVGLRMRVPMRVLQTCLGSAESNLVGVVENVAEGSHRGAGARISSVLDERAQLRDAIERRFESFANASWLPAVTADALDVKQRARQLGVRPSQLADALGIEPGDAEAILEQHRLVEPAQVDVVARLLDVPAADIETTGTRVDEALVAQLDRPRWRTSLQRHAFVEGIAEPEYRRRAAVRLMRRKNRRQGDQIDWAELVEELLG